MNNAAIKSLKNEVLELNPKNAFKGWGKLGRIAKAGKVLGWTGKIVNIETNAKVVGAVQGWHLILL